MKILGKKIKFAHIKIMEVKKKEKNYISKGKKIVFSILAGSLSGLANGLFGGGGGMVVVPMLTKFLRYKPKIAHATAILIILPLSIVSGILYLTFGKFESSIGIPVVIGVIVGGIIGALLLSKISSKWVRLIFVLAMAGAGVKMLFF